MTEKVDTPNTQEAFVLATMESAYFKLLLGDNEGTKVAMDKCEKILDLMDSVDLAVHASFYRVSGDYFKVSRLWRLAHPSEQLTAIRSQAKAEYADYYKNSLLYLACVNVEKDLQPAERVQRAHDLGLSALLGKIYNFGELVRGVHLLRSDAADPCTLTAHAPHSRLAHWNRAPSDQGPSLRLQRRRHCQVRSPRPFALAGGASSSLPPPPKLSLTTVSPHSQSCRRTTPSCAKRSA